MLLLFQAAPVVPVSTTLLVAAATITVGIIANVITAKVNIAYFKGVVETEMKNVNEDIRELKQSRSEQWERINGVEKDIVEIRTNCRNKHSNGKTMYQ